jgi:ATP-dependent Clp protease adaptor protein ClpS
MIMGNNVSKNTLINITLQEVKPKLKKPLMYKVVLINDDFTPMDFVIEVLVSYFSMTSLMAKQVMLEVHFKGKGICGVYSRDVAETKVAQVNNFAHVNDYPLLCVMEHA